MVTEDFVSFETAKLLKEKGFDFCCEFQYINCSSGHPFLTAIRDDADCYYKNSEIEQDAYSAPTLQMAMKWLREVHNLHCHSDYDYILGWYSEITNLKETVEYDYEEMKHYHPEKDNGFSSPEEACEAAIKYCLEILI